MGEHKIAGWHEIWNESYETIVTIRLEGHELRWCGKSHHYKGLRYCLANPQTPFNQSLRHSD